MDKKDIYEHLANIYLDASKTTTRGRNKTQVKSKLIYIGLMVLFLGASAFAVFNLPVSRAYYNAIAAHALTYEAVKINFNFSPAKTEEYTIDLNNLDMAQFKYVDFALRKGNYQDKISLRMEFVNKFNEKSTLYLKDISSKWNKYKIALTEFKNITDWSNMKSFSFIVEEWNSKDTSGVLYIDTIKLLK